MIFTKEEEQQVVQSIKDAEQGTSGEIRVFVEDYCLADHPVSRAEELFNLYGMFNTEHRNAVLLYIAEKSRHFAIVGDAGIHEKVGFIFWEKEKAIFKQFVKAGSITAGTISVIQLVGERLKAYFPTEDRADNNELPNEIIYG